MPPLPVPPKNGDILLVNNPGLLGWLIRRFQKEQDGAAPYSHVALMGKLTRDRWGYLDACGAKLPVEWVGRFVVVEASFTVQCSLLSDYIKRNADLCIVRDTSLTHAERAVIFDSALEQVGLGYSISKLLAYGIDKIFGTKLATTTGPQDLVCSTLIAKAYAKVKRWFEGIKDVREITPDNIWDTAKAGPPWKIIWQKSAEATKPGPAGDEWNLELD